MHDTLSGIPGGRLECTLERSAFDAIQTWFDEYTEAFQLPEAKHQRFITMKIDHTRHVLREIRDLAGSVELNCGGKRLAGAIALLHDVGRFEQYRRYRTFSDLDSEDHAELGIKLIREHGVLRGIGEYTRNLILHAVSRHNKIRLARHRIPEYTLFARLLRDADKLDILRIVVTHYQEKEKPEGGELGLGLSRDPAISASVLKSFLSGRMVRSADIKTLNDLKILQIGWIYDLNFPLTLRKIKRLNYLERIFETLPQTEQTVRVYRKIGGNQAFTAPPVSPAIRFFSMK